MTSGVSAAIARCRGILLGILRGADAGCFLWLFFGNFAQRTGRVSSRGKNRSAPPRAGLPGVCDPTSGRAGTSKTGAGRRHQTCHTVRCGKFEVLNPFVDPSFLSGP